MQKHAAAYALGGKALVAIEVALVAEGKEGTGGRSGDLDLEPVALRPGVQSGGERTTHSSHVRDPVLALQGGERLKRGRHRRRAVPVAAGEEHLFRCAPQARSAQGRRNGIAVRHRLGEADQVGLEAEVAVGTAEMQPESGPDVIEDEHCTMKCTLRLHMGQETGRRHFRGGKEGVVVGGHHYRRGLVAIALHRRVEARRVVPSEAMHMGAVFLDEPTVSGGAPCVDSVVGPFDAEDFFPARVLSCHLHAPCRHVGTVLAEYRPRREVDERHEAFGQLDHHRSGVVEAVAERSLPLRSRLHAGCRYPSTTGP